MAHKKIAVAVDESEESMYALSWCLRYLPSENTENNVFLLYAKPPSPLYSSLDHGIGIFSNDVISKMEKYSKGLMDSVMERANKVVSQDFHNVNIEKEVGCGDAGAVICAMVDKLEPDMLVIGSHGYGFIKRALLGSVSDHCVKHVKCPVLVIKSPKNPGFD